MKDIYVNKEGIICAVIGDNKSLQEFKDSAVPFENRDEIWKILVAHLNDMPLGEGLAKLDSFYQLDCDWEIVEIPWAEIDHQPGSTALMASTKKVARLKVSQPFEQAMDKLTPEGKRESRRLL